MRRVKFWAIGIISFFSIAAGTILHRVLAVSLCTVLGFNSTACFLGDSGRVNAAVPPVMGDRSAIVAQNVDIFRNDGGSSQQPQTGIFDNSNPQSTPQPGVDIFSNPNAPNRPQLPNLSPATNSQQIRPATNSNNSSLIGTRKIAPDRLETQFITREGCQVNKIFRVLNREQIFQEKIQIIAPDKNTCGGISYSYEFQPDGKQIYIEADSDVKFRFIDNAPFIELQYEISGKRGGFRFEPSKASSLNSVLANKSLNEYFNKRQLLSVANKEVGTLIFNDISLLGQSDPRVNADDLGLRDGPSVLQDVDEKLREMGGPGERILRPLVREICQAGEDITNRTLDAATGDATDLALDAALNNAVKDSSEYKVLNLIKKVKDNWDTITNLINKGINLDNLRKIVRDRLKSSFENMLKSRRLGLNCEKFDYNPDADRVITEGCTVCTCCVYTAQYRYSNGHVSGGTFNAPCKGSIEQIVAKINSDLARDIARRQLPYTATVVGTPQRNTQPPPECEDRQVVDVTARISQIDDIATIFVDGRKVKEGGYAGGGKGGDTGWGPMDVGHGKHQVRLVVNNSIPGESGGWFEIKVNGELKINQGRRFQSDRVTGIKYDETTTLEVP